MLFQVPPNMLSLPSHRMWRLPHQFNPTNRFPPTYTRIANHLTQIYITVDHARRMRLIIFETEEVSRLIAVNLGNGDDMTKFLHYLQNFGDYTLSVIHAVGIRILDTRAS